MRQILLLTDGCSNVGLRPETAAAAIYEQGVVVNAVGILENGEIGRHGMEEVKAVAKFGGGIARFVRQADLSQTLQAVTVQAITQTIQRVVSDELARIIGTGALESLPPERRLPVYQMIERIEEEASLRLVVLIDTSASMKSKFRAIEKALNDLSLALQSRRGNSAVCVVLFPGKRQLIDVKAKWTESGFLTERLFSQHDLNGTTPTGPALVASLNLFHELDESMVPTETGLGIEHQQQGWLSDHVV
jgi:Ca-activated chloride channel family protein